MGGASTTTADAKLAGIQIQTSLLGQPIPIGWGRGRLGCNLVDYVGFNALKQTTTTGGGKGGGSSTTISYTYSASIVMVLCEGGPSGIRGVRSVYKDSSVFTNGSTSALAQAGLSLATGTLTQAPWPYLTSMFPDHAIAYSELAYVYAQNYALSSSATLANHGFEIDFAIQSAHAANGDAEPAAIVTDYLTNPSYGVTGWVSGLIGDWSSWNNYTIALGLFLSPVLDGSTTGVDFLKRIATETNSEFFYSEGVLKAKPYGDSTITGNGVTWTPDLTPIYNVTEDDLLDDVQLEIIDQTDAYNYVQVEYLDRSNQYQPAVAVAQDLDNIVTFGLRKRDPEQMHDICEASIAQMVVQLRLQQVLYIRDRYHFTLPEDFTLLEQMDYLSISTTTDGMQLSNQLVIIEEINKQPDGSLEIVAKGVPGQTASAPAYVAHTSTGYQPAVDVDPGFVANPVIFQAPTGLTTNSNEVWIAASGGANWGGCFVWLSYDNESYTKVGTITERARYGATTAALATGADPDTAHTLSVDLSASMGALGSVTQAEADALASLCYLDGEVIAYRDAALTAAYRYDLTYLRRGQSGTSPAAHASGKQFVRLDNAVFRYAHQSADIGRTIYIKLQSYNVYGRAVQDLAALDPYAYTVNPSVAVPDNLAATAASQVIAASRETGIAITGSADGTISISAHNRVYSDKTVSVNGGSLSGFAVGQTIFIYYDDPLRAGGAVTYAGATSAAAAKAGTANPYRHFVGQVTIPATGTAAGYPEYSGDINATYGAPNGTPVGGTTADAVSNAVTNRVPALEAAQATLNANVVAAQAQLASLNTQVAGAATAAASAHDDAATALAQISAEVARAQGAEGALTTSVANLQTSVGSLSSTVSANYTALSSTDASLAASITSLTANYNGLSASYSAQSAAISTLQAQSASYEQRLSAGSPNLCPNGSGELGKTNWTDRAGTWTVNGPDGWGTWFRCLSGFTSGYAYFDSDPIVVFQGNAYTCTLDADSEVSSGSDREAWVELLWFASLADANNLANEITPRTVGPHLSQPWFGNAAANRQALKVTATPPAGANYVRVRPVARGTNLSLAGFRQIKFEQGTLATPYTQEATSYQQYVVQQTDKASLASSISTLTAGVNANTAAISSEATTRASDVATLTSSINTMSSQFVLAGNQLSNTDFPGGNAAGWNWGSTTGAMIYSTGINSPSDDWHPAGENVFAISQGAPVGDQSQYFYLNQSAAAIPGQWYQFYAFVAAHRCTVDLIYFFIDDAGNWLKAGGPQQQTVLIGGKDTGNWSQIGIPAVQAPAGAHRLYIEIRKRDTAAGQADSWMWVWRPYVGPARAGQTAWNPYSAGSGKSVIESAQAAISANFTTLSNNEAALASSITSLTANYNGLSASVSSNASAITTLQAQAASLTTTVSAQGALISSNASAISYLNGQTTALLARVALVLDVNGYTVGYEIDNNGTTGAIKFRADLFEISSPGGGARTEYSGGNWRCYDSSGTLRVRMGVW